LPFKIVVLQQSGLQHHLSSLADISRYSWFGDKNTGKQYSIVRDEVKRTRGEPCSSTILVRLPLELM